MPDSTQPDSPHDRLALAHRLLDVMLFDARIADRLAGSSTELEGPGAHRVAALRELRRRIITPAMIRPIAARRYAETFTAVELTELIAFYNSPLGRKLLAMQANSDDDLRDVITRAYREHADELESLIRETPPELE
jgi:hypothetical protein